MNAKEFLIRAVQCDQASRILEAECYYDKGIRILTDIVNNESDFTKKKVFCERIKEYVDRSNQIKERVRRQYSKGELVSHVSINEDDTGYSYKSLFGKYITTDLKEVYLQEPHIFLKFQFYNLIMFIELLVKQSHNLKFISLKTKTDPNNPSNQLQMLKDIETDLDKRGITLNIDFDDTLHDRKIFFSNGYIIRIGYGLHIFKAPNPHFSLGLTDYEFRKCKQTDVDIWRTNYAS